ncbi:hypothetical protein M436DRAFT_83935 [Aureobasidium namibiae CBS 147.97]|uniref:Uncharacterized protein n=1 Tax=Aureobasidium namibiae CBS 147.97 TaxID=1043004 RepID=A0A074WH59_9PEZI
MPATTISNKMSLHKPLTISFLDLPVEVRYIIYHLLCGNRKKFPTHLGLLSPTWKSPQVPAALMNTCSSIAAELMPLYFGSCLFVLDTTGNHPLRQAAFQWLEKVGERSSAHFRRLRVKHSIVPGYDYEIEITVADNNEITIKELNGGIEAQGVYLAHRRHLDHCVQLGVTMVEDLKTTLTERVNSRSYGGLGAAEFELILERIDFHLSWLKKAHERKHHSNRRQSYFS